MSVYNIKQHGNDVEDSATLETYNLLTVVYLDLLGKNSNVFYFYTWSPYLRKGSGIRKGVPP